MTCPSQWTFIISCVLVVLLPVMCLNCSHKTQPSSQQAFNLQPGLLAPLPPQLVSQPAVHWRSFTCSHLPHPQPLLVSFLVSWYWVHSPQTYFHVGSILSDSDLIVEVGSLVELDWPSLGSKEAVWEGSDIMGPNTNRRFNFPVKQRLRGSASPNLRPSYPEISLSISLRFPSFPATLLMPRQILSQVLSWLSPWTCLVIIHWQMSGSRGSQSMSHLFLHWGSQPTSCHLLCQILVIWLTSAPDPTLAIQLTSAWFPINSPWPFLHLPPVSLLVHSHASKSFPRGAVTHLPCFLRGLAHA